MKKIAIALALAVVGTTAAFAGPIEDRQAIMKGFAGPMKDATALSRGTTPYTPAAAKAAMDQLAASGEKFITLFPAGTANGGAGHLVRCRRLQGCRRQVRGRCQGGRRRCRPGNLRHRHAHPAG